MDYDALEELFGLQDGVVSRRQLLGIDATDNDIERMLRRRAMARMHDGVYVNHTGRPSWTQRAWAAVLYYWPAALAGRSALRAFGVRNGSRPDDDEASIEVAIDESRSVAPLPGVRVSRIKGFADLAMLHLCPPRIRLEHALLTVAAKATDESSSVAVLAEACQTRRTTASHLLETLRTRRRLPRRKLLLSILADVAAGAYSVLERHYLTRVERAHGLPTGRRQRRVKPGESVAFRMSTTTAWVWWWSSTAGSDTRTRRTGGRTSTETSSRLSTETSPFESDGDKCCRRAGSPPRSRAC